MQPARAPTINVTQVTTTQSPQKISDFAMLQPVLHSKKASAEAMLAVAKKATAGTMRGQPGQTTAGHGRGRGRGRGRGNQQGPGPKSPGAVAASPQPGKASPPLGKSHGQGNQQHPSPQSPGAVAASPQPGKSSAAALPATPKPQGWKPAKGHKSTEKKSPPGRKKPQGKKDDKQTFAGRYPPDGRVLDFAELQNEVQF